MIYFKRFILLFRFLTIIPVPVNIDGKDEDYGKGLVFAPIVGLLLGGILFIVYLLSSKLFPVIATSAIVLTVYIILTGGLHLDGLGDTFDGLFSNRPKEMVLEIMRDSRVGTNAVLALVSILIIDNALLNGLNPLFEGAILLLFPVAGRIGLPVAAGVSRYAREGEGLGKSFIGYCGIKEVILASIIHLTLFFSVLGLKGVVLGLVLIFSSLLVVKVFSLKIGGATGDTLGAVCEINQTIYLAMVYVFSYGL